MTIKNTAATGAAALAIAAAGFFAVLPAQVSAADAQVHCYGVTGCKGQNDCKTAENACKGQAECKGHGFKAMTQAECDAAGGKAGE